MADHLAPSRGERNAIIGYKSQYDIAAIKIIEAIRSRFLESILIADPEAGRVDDIQILTPNRIDAYQVKWSEYSALVTFNDIISPGPKSKPCLIAQLADGWKRLKIKHPGRRVVVHLIMRDNPSPNKAPIPAGEKIPDPYHFAGFISQIWNNVHSPERSSDFEIPIEWKPAWDKLREASGLVSNEEFIDFVRDCDLELGYKISSFEELPIKERLLLTEQISIISKKLFDLVANSGASVEYSAREFLQLLDWPYKNQLLNAHDFPVDERLYKKIEGLGVKFEQLITTTENGYIAVIGSPGSGKSTFLTQILKNRNERVVKYYSFIPDSIEPVNLRGESKNFLHDIIFQLEREGFSSGGSISSSDRTLLLKRFHDQMQQLHSEWRKDHRKTIILIDGLDHIPREQLPEFSLLNDLPSPGNIPDGVIFLLGSQTDEIFPSGIKSEVRHDRKIEMQPLSRQAVTEIVSGACCHVIPTVDQIFQIYTLSDGHPLALNYIINMIQDVQSVGDIAKILNNLTKFTGNIEQQYQSYWDEVNTNPQLYELFGLIARVKTDIDLGWFETWYVRAAIIELRKKFSHYFKRDNCELWSFFHNSFRIFVHEKTCDSGQGVIDPQKSVYYHKILAEQSIKYPEPHNHDWDEIYHRFYANQFQEIVDLTTPEYFRDHFINFRSIPEIKKDINIALSSAKELKNFIIFSRLILTGSEYEQRFNHLDQISYFPLLFYLLRNERKLCLNHIISGNSLQIKNEKALGISKDLADISYDDAKKIFHLSEPFDVLIAKKPIQNFRQFDPDLLYTWAASAPYFRDSPDLIKLIKNCQQKNPHLAHKSMEEGILEFQRELLYRVAISFITLEQWDDVKLICDEIIKYPHSPVEPDEFNLYNWSWERCEQRDKHDEAKFFLGKGKEFVGETYLSPDNEDFNPNHLINLATGIFRIDNDLTLVKKYLQHVSLSKNVHLNLDTIAFSNPNLVFSDYVKYIKITFYLGGEYRPIEEIPSTGNKDEELLTEFTRNLYTISYISALGDTNQKLTGSLIEELISPLIRFYNKDFFTFHKQKNGTIIRQVKEEYFKFLASAVIKHEDDTVRILQKVLDEEWSNPNNRKYWSTKTWENFLIILNHRGVDKKWCLDKLTSLQSSMLQRPNDFYDTYQRVNEYFEYAKTWYSFNDYIKSKANLSKTFQTSFGIGFRKDYQLNSWIKWLDIINEIEPEKRITRTLYFVNIILKLHEYVEKRADFYAAEDLISITFDWSPKRALILTKLFVDVEILPEDHARNFYLSELLQSDSQLQIEEIIPYVDIMLFSEEIGSLHKKILELVILQSHKIGNEFCNRIIGYLIESINQKGSWSPTCEWHLIIAENAKKIGLNPSKFGLNIDELEAIVKSKKSTSYDVNEKIPQELLQHPVEPSVLIRYLPDLKYHYVWEPVVRDIISTYTKEQIQEVVNAISGNSDLFVILGLKLLEINDSNGAKNAAIKAINECKWGGYGLPSDYGAKVESFKILMKIDKNFAKEIAIKTLFNDLTIHYPYFYTVAIQMHNFMPNLVDNNDQITQIWGEIQEYLNQILTEYELPSVKLDNFIDEITDDTVSASFIEFQNSF